ncbi:cell wall metabolism sensor histidine kinase WalK [Bacillus sp. OK048]|uniref:sensor histidine kinase n=1 Tax=Bacillus sp. OK048 TaxID=1882761 RepID=UPI00088AF613|nr:HAMP domain-containing sensor histidine kinase [Bacillus sp. OK048]SDN67870.1 histidine kinase [Bacillus sp. OK048]
MSIRLRLLLSNLAMILVPIIFVCLSALLVALLFRGDIKELRNIYLPPEHYGHMTEKNQLLIDLHKETMKNPGEFLDQTYLQKIDSQLNKTVGTSLAVRKGKQMIYVPAKLKGLEMNELPPFGFFGEVDPVERIDHQFISIKKLDFFYPDGAEGSLFFVTDASSFAKFVRTSFPILFIGLIIILIGTNGLLTYHVSRGIIRPIRGLQKAAKRMEEGDLTLPIPVTSKDEIGQLAQGFEEMRVRLKESIETQLAYEENRKELIANISHDLKTPITTIKGYVEGIRDGVANSPEKIDRYMQTIHSKSIELDHMIDELFLYSKLDLQRLPFHFEKIRFDHYLQDFVEDLRFDLEEKGVEITLNIENGDYHIIGDREHLKRVITNIVDNSLKYIDKPDKVLSFHIATIDSTVLFSMTDNGPGITEENLSIIFDRFYRVDTARGTEKGGSGLGLSIAKRIIEEHHGSIWAESRQGQGTTISFTLNKAGEEK